MVTRVYKHSDAGAPQLGNSSAGDLITILRACLVDGYGTRTPQGWTMPFSDLPNNKAAFRSVNGNHIRVDDNYDYRWCKIRGYANMTTVDDGTGKYPNDTDLSTNFALHWFKRYTNSVNYDNWTLIVDDDWFYYFNYEQSDAESYPSAYFFGNYDSLNPAYVTDRSLIVGYAYTDNNSPSATSGTLAGLFGTTGQWFASDSYLQGGGQPTRLYHDMSDAIVDYVNPNPITGKLDFVQTHLRTGSPYVRYGNLPKILMKRSVNSARRTSFRNASVITIDAKKYVMITQNLYTFIVEYDEDVG